MYGLADICYDDGTMDILQIFDRQFWCNEIYISNIPVQNIQSQIANTVGQNRKLKQASIIYSNLTDSNYNYKVNTTITILENISSTIDKIKIIQTGRVGYIIKKCYK